MHEALLRATIEAFQAEQARQSIPEFAQALLRDIRAHFVMRQWRTEDELGKAIEQGVTKYVSLGVQLDSVASRRPDVAAFLRIFAAHPMFPVGGNGASQAILYARCGGSLLAETKDVVMALKAYEAAHLSVTAKIVPDNRAGGPERVIDVAEERAPDAFVHLSGVASHAEFEAVVKGYSKMTGFDQTQVNRAKDLGSFEASPRRTS